MKFFTKHLVLFLMLMLPAIAFAATLNPPGGNAWDMYVYGNARAIFNVLEGVKMLMVPDAGHTGFTTLLLLLATIGFLVLAISAGFDPSRNLMRMFTYIFVVYFVVFSTTGLKANVNITDMIKDPSGVSTTYTVSGAPALVVMPAALTTEIGRYFTRTIEAYFVMPEEFKLAGAGGGGQFNLFGKLMKESSEYIITNSELKKSLASYSTDCVVPAIALGNLKGSAYDRQSNSMVPVYGVNALLRSNNMSEVFSSAGHAAILTKYYPVDDKDVSWKNASSIRNDADAASFSNAQASALGVLMSCADASELLFGTEGAIATYANLLSAAGSSAWAKIGATVPFETLMQSMIASAGAGSSTYGYSKPTGLIMQQALINSMNGSFKQAAIQSGNNELMQAVSITQAEQSQRSSWVATAQVFNNMMGYIYVTLQAFIFAITPLIVVAALVPGLGKSIFVNYAQILIWLMLWQPMLAIINYLITLFGTESISTIVSADGGLSPNNKYLISAKTNDLMIAAGFLGSMVPLIAWGLVKGTLAFTEFITAGIGSSFASQAGAQAATGNVSMNNSSLDNISMNKFNTAMSSAVGAQSVSMYMGSGSVSSQADMGGSGTSANMSAVAMGQAASNQLSESKAYAQAYSSAISFIQSKGLSEAIQMVESGQWSDGSAQSKAISDVANYLKSGSLADSSADNGLGHNGQLAAGKGAGANSGTTDTNSGSVSGSIGGKTPIIGGEVGANKKIDSSHGNQSQEQVTSQDLLSENKGSFTKDSAQLGNSGSVGGGTSSGNSRTLSDIHSIQDSVAHGANLQEALSKASNYSEQIQHNITAMEGVVSDFKFSESVDFKQAQFIMHEIMNIKQNLETTKDLHFEKMDAEQSNFQGKQGADANAINTDKLGEFNQDQVAHDAHRSRGGTYFSDAKYGAVRGKALGAIADAEAQYEKTEGRIKDEYKQEAQKMFAKYVEFKLRGDKNVGELVGDKFPDGVKNLYRGMVEKYEQANPKKK